MSVAQIFTIIAIIGLAGKLVSIMPNYTTAHMTWSIRALRPLHNLLEHGQFTKVFCMYKQFRGLEGAQYQTTLTCEMSHREPSERHSASLSTPTLVLAGKALAGTESSL